MQVEIKHMKFVASAKASISELSPINATTLNQAFLLLTDDVAATTVARPQLLLPQMLLAHKHCYLNNINISALRGKFSNSL